MTRFEHVAALVLQIVIVAEADKREDARVGTPASGGGEERQVFPAEANEPVDRSEGGVRLRADAGLEEAREPAGLQLLFSERKVRLDPLLRRAVEHGIRQRLLEIARRHFVGAEPVVERAEFVPDAGEVRASRIEAKPWACSRSPECFACAKSHPCRVRLSKEHV